MTIQELKAKSDGIAATVIYQCAGCSRDYYIVGDRYADNHWNALLSFGCRVTSNDHTNEIEIVCSECQAAEAAQ